MPSRPANVSLIHRRCPGRSAAPGREQTHQPEPDPLTFCSMSEAALAAPGTARSPRRGERRAVALLANLLLPLDAGGSAGCSVLAASSATHGAIGSVIGLPAERRKVPQAG